MAIEKKTVKKVAISYSAFGKRVKKPFKVPYTFDIFKNMDSVREAKAELSEKQQLKAINAAIQAKERSAVLNAAYEAAGFEKDTAATSALIRLKDFYKTLMLSKKPDGSPYTHAEARQIASQYVNAQWPAEDDVEDTEDETEDTDDGAEDTEEEPETAV